MWGGRFGGCEPAGAARPLTASVIRRHGRRRGEFLLPVKKQTRDVNVIKLRHFGTKKMSPTQLGVGITVSYSGWDGLSGTRSCQKCSASSRSIALAPMDTAEFGNG